MWTSSKGKVVSSNPTLCSAPEIMRYPDCSKDTMNVISVRPTYCINGSTVCSHYYAKYCVPGWTGCTFTNALVNHIFILQEESWLDWQPMLYTVRGLEAWAVMDPLTDGSDS